LLDSLLQEKKCLQSAGGIAVVPRDEEVVAVPRTMDEGVQFG